MLAGSGTAMAAVVRDTSSRNAIGSMPLAPVVWARNVSVSLVAVAVNVFEYDSQPENPWDATACVGVDTVVPPNVTLQESLVAPKYWENWPPGPVEAERVG